MSRIIGRTYLLFRRALRVLSTDPVARAAAWWILRGFVDLDDSVEILLDAAPLAWRQFRRVFPREKKSDSADDDE